MTSWGPLILTAVVPVGVLLCEVAVFCYDEFGSGGVPVVEQQLHSYCCSAVGSFQIVCSCTGSYTGLICKMNSYLCRNEISLAGRLEAISCCRLALESLRPCKFILVKDFIVASRCVEFGLASWYLSPVVAI